MNESIDSVALLDLGDVADMTQGGQPVSGNEDKRYEYS